MEERFRFRNDDGLILSGVYLAAPVPTARCVVLCHGLTYDKDEAGLFAELADELNHDGFPVFRFDFRAHGESEGSSVGLTVTGERRDLEAAIREMKARGHTEFGLLGASFGGGAVALHAADHADEVLALVFWNAIVDYEDFRDPKTDLGRQRWGPEAMARLEAEGSLEVFPKSPFRIGKDFITETRFLEPWRGLADLTIPKLFIHGDRDRLVRYDFSVTYATKLPNAELITIPGADHGFRSSPEHGVQAIQAAVEFFAEVMPAEEL